MIYMEVNFYSDDSFNYDSWLREDNFTVNSEEDVERIHKMLDATSEHYYEYTWRTV